MVLLFLLPYSIRMEPIAEKSGSQNIIVVVVVVLIAVVAKRLTNKTHHNFVNVVIITMTDMSTTS